MEFEGEHSIQAFCVGVFLSLYLNAKLKAFSDYHTSSWKLIVVMIPLLGAILIAASVIMDHVNAPLPLIGIKLLWL